MRCPSCGEAELVHDTRSVSFTYMGKKCDLSPVPGLFCPGCGEALLGPQEARLHTTEMASFIKSVAP